MAKEYLGKQTVASLIRLMKNEFAKYTKKTDYGSQSAAGLCKGSVSYGTYVGNGGVILIQLASNDEILSKNQGYKPIVPKNLDYAIKVGLTDNKEAWTEEEKAAARNLLGVTDQIGDIETALDSIIAIQENLIGGDEA